MLAISYHNRDGRNDRARKLGIIDLTPIYIFKRRDNFLDPKDFGSSNGFSTFIPPHFQT